MRTKGRSFPVGSDGVMIHPRKIIQTQTHTVASQVGLAVNSQVIIYAGNGDKQKKVWEFTRILPKTQVSTATDTQALPSSYI